MGIRPLLELKWILPVKSPFITNSSTRAYFSSVRSREACYESASMSILSVSTEENSAVEMEEKMKFDNKGLHKSLHNPMDSETIRTDKDGIFTSNPHDQVINKSHYGLLMENLGKIEEIIADTDLVRLEKDILTQIGKLGALNLFNACLSRTLKTPPASVSMPLPITVPSIRKEERKLRRKRAAEKAAKISGLSPVKQISKISQLASYSRSKVSSNTRRRKLLIAKNESEMSLGIQVVTKLERIRTTLEEESGMPASLSSWAQAARLDEKELQKRLHFGWSCRDRLLRSTRSLVMYLARNYRGLGVPFEDLLQAGNLGVLQGSERFDPTRGYQFSTYVQYWIRKSMLKLLAQNSKGVQIPMAVNRVINQIQKARKAHYSLHGRYPNDGEISSYTGLPLAKIKSASKCPRIVGSINQKMGYSISVRFMDFTPDTAIKTPEQVVMRQHMEKSISELLQLLDPRERQVLVLRYGLWDGQCKSLAEIGKIFKCSKEWIRKIEKSALTKAKTEQVQRNLSHYLIS